ncbi:molybdopterin molybdenumtransferase MoeA [Lacihabitans sp. LS3-19]|uniref:molybdopterin molybdotransferase MoeA n=1 Tax=Lacihabitans sp. LS3-19 TaxID=2487335 RepID=UPI0020CF5F9C|nr:molybdopterin molybdotransferase MoeA [Lacihabitans sp. LS3-19]MCP9766307.1 molybdopterin molybdenumtransferase MoeA [Lacihabitans sp. LS3-19]
MVSVEKAFELIMQNTLSLKVESIPFQKALGHILAEDLVADRNFPPFDRVTMDGIAIDFKAYKNGRRKFKIQEMQAAGDEQITLSSDQSCIEIMTGGVLPKNTDTVIRYEDVEIVDGMAEILVDIKQGQNIHLEGVDKKQGELVLKQGTKINASHIALAASLGKENLNVYVLPKIAIISSGDELVDVTDQPLPHQIRKSNVYAIETILKKVNAEITHFHIADDLENSVEKIKELLKEFSVLIFSGGVSMGKKDFIPEALAQNSVIEVFHKISQKPGKPMWFGKTDKNLVFALPGNPVSTYLCTLRYVLPFLEKSLGTNKGEFQKVILGENIVFKPKLSYFLQVKIINENGAFYAFPLKHNGSGDFISLINADGFVELPNSENDYFEKGKIVNFFAI